MEIIRIIVCMVGTFVFGVIYAEILNGFRLFDIGIPVYAFAGTISLIFLFSELMLKRFETRSARSRDDEIRFKKIKRRYYKGLAFVNLILLILVPFIWWGAIKRLATMAHQGVR